MTRSAAISEARKVFRTLARSAAELTSPGRTLVRTRGTQTPVRARHLLRQRLDPALWDVYWPLHPTSVVQNARRIVIGIETSPGMMPGCYLQGLGGIIIDDYTQVGPHVGIHSNNHDVYSNHLDVPRPVKVGAYCWLGMGAQLLAGVELGDFTIVGAGAIVTKSFAEGYCVIAGNPARMIRPLDRDRCIRHQSNHRYHGFVPDEDFARFRRERLEL